MKFDLADVDHRSIATTNMRWGGGAGSDVSDLPRCVRVRLGNYGITTGITGNYGDRCVIPELALEFINCHRNSLSP